MFVPGDLERQLEAARARLKTAQLLARKLHAAEAQLAEYRKKNKQLALILNKEKRDVNKLENLSLSSLFCTILGTKDEKLDRERQEYLAAKLTYDTARQVLLEVEQDVQGLKEQLELYQNAHTEYKQLLQEKEEVLKRQDNPTSRELLALAEEEAKLAVRQKELQEAAEAARHTLLAIGQLLNSLNSAANWGTWDMLGGGLLSTAVKHSRINDARQQVQSVQRNLNRLQRELSDVQVEADLDIDIKGFISFADYFFDGLIADWVVQSRINEARKRAEKLEEDVKALQQMLSGQLRQNEQKTAAIQKQREMLIGKNSI